MIRYKVTVEVSADELKLMANHGLLPLPMPKMHIQTVGIQDPSALPRLPEPIPDRLNPKPWRPPSW